MAELMEMRELLGNRLYDILKDRINGYITIEFINDALSVSIVHNNTGWRAWITNFDEYMIYGYSLDTVANIIVQNYKKAVMAEYFYTGK